MGDALTETDARLREMLWDGLRQPRPAGALREAYRLPGAPAHLRKLAARLEPRPLARRSLDVTEAAAFLRARARFAYAREVGEHGDEMLYGLASDYGFAGLPHAVSEAEVEAEVEAGGVEVWRGERDPDAFLTGSYHAELGHRGNGILVAYGVGARQRAQEHATTVLRMALHRDANVGVYSEVAEEAKLEHLRLGEASFRNGVPTVEAVLAEIARDPGRYALTHGWDALVLGEHEMLVLNRTALLVEVG